MSQYTVRDCQDLMTKYSYCVEVKYIPDNLNTVLAKHEWESESIGAMNTVLYATTHKNFYFPEEGKFLFLKDKKDYLNFIQHF